MSKYYEHAVRSDKKKLNKTANKELTAEKTTLKLSTDKLRESKCVQSRDFKIKSIFTHVTDIVTYRAAIKVNKLGKQ